MNLKSTILTLLVFWFFITVEANTITQNEAEKIARNFIYLTANTYAHPCTLGDIRLNDPFTYRIGQDPVFYAFQMNPGFIIVSADDAYMPVIGYSFEGRFNFDEAPASYKGFIANYADEIEYIRNNNIQPDSKITDAWNELRSTDITTMEIIRGDTVTPLLQNHWDQGSPYNKFCPEDAAGPGGHVWAGCVATAMAQIMYYWRYPETGTGSHCYSSSYGQQCANFGETTYDWANMINGIDPNNPDANATLQYHCAVSVNMNFGPDGSGAQSQNVPGSLNQYFRYNNAIFESKSDHSYADWVNLLKTDIDAGKPLYYSGYNSNWEGHAFVCDGYQGENFHFNFGWSGSSNGYYSLYDVGGFSNWQNCVRNFAPTDGNYPYYCTGTKTLTSKSGSISDGSGPVHNYQDNSTAYWLIDPQTIYDSITSITLTFSQFDLVNGDYVKIYDGATTSSPLLGTFTGTTLPSAQTSSANTMLIEFHSDGSGNAKGFYAEYSTVSPVWCQGLTAMTEPSGTISDGSGAFYYQSSATCMWRIKPAFANKITLYFNYFDTEPGLDVLTVYDGTTQIGAFSGHDIPDALEATSGTMFITWHTSQADNFQGWEAYYEVDNVGIDEAAALTDLEVYPNPASENIHVRLQLQEKSSLTIRLLNLTGQTVYTQELPEFEGAFQKDIPVESLPAGLYFLELKTQTGKINKKVLIN